MCIRDRIQGALKIKKQFPDTLLLFITPPSAQELVRRLTDRGTEDHETILALSLIHI